MYKMSIKQKQIILFLQSKGKANIQEIAEHLYYLVDDARLQSTKASLRRLIMNRFISQIDKGVYVAGVK